MVRPASVDIALLQKGVIGLGAFEESREYVNQTATLPNCRAEEAQYLAILKRATAAKDILDISSNLAEVRGRTEQLHADLRFLHHQAEMSLLPAIATWTVTVLAVIKVDWVVLRRLALLFFPGLDKWLRDPAST